ncbi:MAG: tetratricopeptide repeat protein [Cyanobacteria bacterium P01_G01_bin.39]
MSTSNGLIDPILTQSVSSNQVETPIVSGQIKDLIGGSLIFIGIIFIATAIAGRIGNWVELKSAQRQGLAGVAGLIFFFFGYSIISPQKDTQNIEDSPPPANTKDISEDNEKSESSLDEDCQYEIDSVKTAKLVKAACEKSLLASSDNYEVLRNLGRAKLLLWDSRGSRASEEDLNEVIDKFESAVRQSDYQDANSVFHLALALSIRHFEKYDNKYELGPAKDAYEKSFELFTDPKTQIREIDFTPMVENGHYFAKNCRDKKADKIYNRVLAKDPHDYGALTSKLIALSEKAKREKASDKTPDYSEIDELLKKDSIKLRTSSALRFNLGSIAVLKNDFKSAAAYYRDAYNLKKNFSQALRNEALSLMISSGINDTNLELLTKATEEANRLNVEIKIPTIDKDYTQNELKQLLLNFAGFFSDHDALSEQDPVVEVRHDKLYPGAPCQF